MPVFAAEVIILTVLCAGGGASLPKMRDLLTISLRYRKGKAPTLLVGKSRAMVAGSSIQTTTALRNQIAWGKSERSNHV